MAVVIQYNKRTNQYYAYESHGYWDKELKQARSRRKVIGRYNPVTKEITPTDGRMKRAKEKKDNPDYVPNKPVDHKKKEQLTIKRIQNYGVSSVMLHIAKQTGLLEVLQNSFPSKWEQMLAVAFYFVTYGGVMSYIEDWFDETKIDFVESFNDGQCSKLFASISYEERQGFFKEWVKYRSEQEYIAYDVTSISTYSRNIELAEYGYNRDNEKLPMINYGMFYGTTSNMPVYYNAYSGSIPDVASLEYMLLNAKDIGIHKTTFVIDEGFVSKTNLSFLLEKQYSFITIMPSSKDEYHELIKSVSTDIEDGEKWIKDYKVHGTQKPVLLDGNNLYAHVFYSSARKTSEIEAHYDYIDKLQMELDKLSNSKTIPNRYNAYFKIEGQTPSSFSYEIDHQKANKKLKTMGYFILLTNNPALTSAEVLKIYRGKDIIEKHFDQFKNDLDFGRLRTHQMKTTEGKIFIGFLALILRSHMLNLIKRNEATKKYTFEKVMIELKKIKSVILSDMKQVLTVITKTQRVILASLGVEKDLILVE